MSIVKRKLAGIFFEYKEIKPKINVKKNFEDINKNDIMDLQSKLEWQRNFKIDESIDQSNNNSNNNILNVNKKPFQEYILINNLIKNLSKEITKKKSLVYFLKEIFQRQYLIRKYYFLLI